MISAQPRTVQRGELSFATEAFGDRTATPVLMIMGATASMLWWPDELCAAIAASGRYVIRYDNRDTGQSTTVPPGSPPYTIEDMADDAAAILDGYDLPRAHLVGMSLGGMIAQLVALRHPSRVLSLTLISSAAFDEEDADLPPMDPALLEHFGALARLDWNNREAVIDFHVRSFEISAGDSRTFDRDRARHLAGREYDRAINPQSAFNHSMLKGGESWAGRLGEIRAPALIIHGRHDPILSLRHGQKLGDALKAIRFIELDAGHELREADWPVIVEAIRDFTEDPA